MTKAVNKHWVFYTGFGLELRTRGSDFITTCPFCLKEDHFGIKQDSGVANCLRCGKSCNHYSFIRDFHALCLSTTTEESYERLARNRSLLTYTLKQAQLAMAPNGTWLIPSRNETGVVMNLYRAIPYEEETSTTALTTGQGSPGRQQGSNSIGRPPVKRPPANPVHSGQLDGNRTKFNIQSTGEPCSQQLYGLDLIQSQSTIIIVEGHWDRLALWEVFASLVPLAIRNIACLDLDIQMAEYLDYNNELLRHVGILGTPGANQWKPEWCKHLRNKNVILIYDNDPDRVICPTCRGMPGYKAHRAGSPCPQCGGSKTTNQIINPGRDGLTKVVKELDETGTPVSSLLQVKWMPSDPKDIRDLLAI